ncbi:hypothetical protein [Staphylococcus gallinarum]|uniref:hypothetical protein n=1 Tax=Staphylococcus gallinarum TaxID=1293 RepID=UPI003F55C9C9
MNKCKIQKIKENIAEYEQEEFEIDYNPSSIFEYSLVEPIANTTFDENELIEIQVNLDLERLLLITELKPTSTNEQQRIAHYEYERFDSLDDVLEFTKIMDFDELVRINADEEDIYKFFGIEYSA